jgi:hypothetical protein
MDMPTSALRHYVVGECTAGPASFPKAQARSAQPSIVRAPAEAAPLTALERIVVALAYHDHWRSVQDPGRFGLFLFRLIGGRVPNRISDPKLEALRRFAVMYRHADAVLDDERTRFSAAGFGPEAEDEVRRLVDGAERT